eukprot:8057855-Lingulodinium_polyedra.AAC.1
MPPNLQATKANRLASMGLEPSSPDGYVDAPSLQERACAFIITGGQCIGAPRRPCNATNNRALVGICFRAWPFDILNSGVYVPGSLFRN